MQASPSDSHLIAANPITRGEFLVALAAGGAALASPTVAHDGGRMMWDFMTGYIRLLDQKRRERFAAIETAEDLDVLRRKVRSRLAEMWGPFPKEKTPLNPQRLGVIERQGYRIEKIIYESRPRLFVPVNLYRPTRRRRTLSGHHLSSRSCRGGEGLSRLSEVLHSDGSVRIRRSHLGFRSVKASASSFGTRKTTARWLEQAPGSTACWGGSATCWVST